MEQVVEILQSAKSILLCVDEEYERLARQYEHLLDKQNEANEACDNVTEELKTLSELESRWFGNKLWTGEPCSIIGDYRTKDNNWISSFEDFEQFCKNIEESSKDSTLLVDFAKELRTRKLKLNDEALVQYKTSKQGDKE